MLAVLAAGSLSLSLSLGTLLAPAQESARTPARIAALTAELERLMETHRIPGMSAAVVQDRSLAWSHGFGLSDLENEVCSYGMAWTREGVRASPFARAFLQAFELAGG